MQALEAHGKAPRRGRTWLLIAGAIVLVVAAAAIAYGIGKSSWLRLEGREEAAAPTQTTVKTARPRFPSARPRPGAGHVDRGLQRRHQHHVLVPGHARVGHADLDARRGRSVGAAQPDDHSLRPGGTAHPVGERSGDHPRRATRASRPRTGASFPPVRRSASPWRTATSCASRSSWRSSTTSRCPSPPAARGAGARRTQPTPNSGTFAWRWPMPAELTSLWTQGVETVITKAAVVTFENQNGLTVDGLAGPKVWSTLLADVAADKVDSAPYTYVLVSKVLPENLTLYNNGVAQYTEHPGQHRRPRRRHDRRHLPRLRARDVLGDEGDEPRRHDLRRPQRAVGQLLQRGRRTARLRAGQVRLPPEQRLRRNDRGRCRHALAPDADRDARHRREARPPDQADAGLFGVSGLFGRRLRVAAERALATGPSPIRRSATS